MTIPRLESMLQQALAAAAQPPRLAAAMHDAVFAGAGRLRPRLCLAVSAACGAVEGGSGAAHAGHAASAACGAVDTAWAAAAAIELLHSASLVHDDLPCFDDAATRRGRPSVHRRHGQALAVLAGDGLIVAAFATLARARADAAIVTEVAGAASRLVGGQGLESEQRVAMAAYHAAKTGALFEAAAACGALAAQQPAAPWRRLGQALGRAYQLADDIADVADDGGTPNQARARGVAAAGRQLTALLARARATVPAAAAAGALDGFFAALSARLPAAAAAPARPRDVAASANG